MNPSKRKRLNPIERFPVEIPKPSMVFIRGNFIKIEYPSTQRAKSALNAILKAMPAADSVEVNDTGRRYIARWKQ